LESSDPQRFERIKQIQELQKEVIAKADEVIRCDLLIQEKEKVYVELKAIIARQPGPEVEEQLLTYQQTLKEKSKQLAAMDDELDMYRQQVSVYKEEIIDTDKRLERLKKQWLKSKKADFLAQSGTGSLARKNNY
jgi:preprotein translocase subunit Sec63